MVNLRQRLANEEIQFAQEVAVIKVDLDVENAFVLSSAAHTDENSKALTSNTEQTSEFVDQSQANANTLKDENSKGKGASAYCLSEIAVKEAGHA